MPSSTNGASQTLASSTDVAQKQLLTMPTSRPRLAGTLRRREHDRVRQRGLAALEVHVGDAAARPPGR